MPESRRQAVQKMLDMQPINVRVLDGFDLDRCEIKREDEGTNGYEIEALDEQAAHA
jgi:hypothetical protein